MNIFNEIIKSPCETAVALGYFDGIHLGHQQVIKNAVACKQQGLTPVVFTFQENPANLVTGKKVQNLMMNDQKFRFLSYMKVEYTYCVDFSDVMDMSAAEFVQEILVNTLKAKKVFCGFNYHFGSGAQGDAERLKELCEKYDIEVVTVAPVMYKDEPISSTRIRHSLKQGKIQDVSHMLGREFSYRLPVHKGNQLGRQMGTPTFNQPMPSDLILPKYGVYASAVNVGGRYACGVTNIGVKPTVGSDGPLSETWMPREHCGELYGKEIEVRLLDFIRSETKFVSVIELKAAILADGEQALKIFDGK
ncbi:MAG TPA: bifunctional riboflavin kinase/FAD synthetase [Clostridiales bacterium]|nr:bifunctional riboflavin kinase/FAD synthetase [Clostridiales bacterium]